MSGALSNLGENGWAYLLGMTAGIAVFLCGGLAGYFIGRRRPFEVAGESVDRRRVLTLLRELGAWTREYRGGVAQYQERLDQITMAARAQEGTVADKGVKGVIPLVEQLMHSNRRLQARLDAAEKQLEQQTRQIEVSLSEARTDALTGLANRRAFDQRMEELFAAFERSGRSFVLALVDIDHFKKINDTHGHPTGDAVLRRIADRLRSEISGAELVARIGGEEFAILLSSPLRTAANQLDSFRRSCAKEPLACEGHELPITVSVGLSETRDDRAIGPLVRRADEALYAAKGIGRNRTYFHDGEAPVLLGAPEVAKR